MKNENYFFTIMALFILMGLSNKSYSQQKSPPDILNCDKYPTEDGQLNGLGAHWELWMLQQGGMGNMQALRCATLNGAKYLGLDKEIGSLAAGKLADLIILDKNPLDDIKNTESIRFVMVNGRLYESETLNEIGNYDKKRDKFWFEMPGTQTSNGAGMRHTCHEQKCVCGH